MIRRWNTTGSVAIEVPAELIIEFQSKGYHDPGSMCGGPDGLGWPPEGDDERTLIDAYLMVDGRRVNLDAATQAELFEEHSGAVHEAEIETDTDDDYR